MKKGVPHDLWLLEGDKERNTVSRCWNFLEIWPYPGVSSSAQRNRHSISDLEIRVATWWLLGEQVNLQPSPFMASYKRPFSKLKLSHKPSFSSEKRFHFPLTEVQVIPRRGSQLQEHNTPRVALMMLLPRVEVRFTVATCEKAQINFLLVLGSRPSCSPSKLQDRMQD